MTYRKSNLILPPKGSPLDKKDMIIRQVNKEDYKEWAKTETPVIEPPRALQSVLKPSVGKWNLFINNVVGFANEFRP